MKIITAATNWDLHQLAQTLQLKLNPLFREARLTDIEFDVVENGDAIEITQTKLYEGYLFRLTAKGKQLHVAKSENYVDDVNQLTLQSILETLQMDSMAGADIIYISGE